MQFERPVEWEQSQCIHEEIVPNISIAYVQKIAVRVQRADRLEVGQEVEHHIEQEKEEEEDVKALVKVALFVKHWVHIK